MRQVVVNLRKQLLLNPTDHTVPDSQQSLVHIGVRDTK